MLPTRHVSQRPVGGTSVPVRVATEGCQVSSLLFWSDPAEHLKEGGHGMHVVEEVHGNGEVENSDPYAEAERLLLQAVVVLWPAAEGGEDPQL